MSKQILMTFLGAGKYNNTVYEWQGQTSSRAYKFAAVALSEIMKPERVIAFGTKLAQAYTLEDFNAQMKQVGYEPEIVTIDEGDNQQELWNIFDMITAEITEKDHVIFDITNSFRSLPVLGVLAFVYMKNGLDISVDHLLYGAYDKSQGTTPILDLTPMIDLIEWSSAAKHFNRSGDSTELAELVQKDDPALAENMRMISRSYLLLQPHLVRETVERMVPQLEAAGITMKKPFSLLLGRIKKTYLKNLPASPKGHDPKELLQQEKDMIIYYKNHGHLMQAFSLAREWLISWAMAVMGVYDFDDSDRRYRFEALLNGKSEWNEIEAFRNKLAARQIDSYAFTDTWVKIRNIRNAMDHAGQVDFLRIKSMKDMNKALDALDAVITLKIP